MWVRPEVGDLCLYRTYQAGGAFADFAAIITDVTAETIVSLTQFQKSGAPISRSGVNHVKKVPHTNGNAGWCWRKRAFMHGSADDCNNPP
jgi:hypothetical protein